MWNVRLRSVCAPEEGVGRNLLFLFTCLPGQVPFVASAAIRGLGPGFVFEAIQNTLEE